MSTKQSDAETFGSVEPVDILPMGGGYDWRQFAPEYGPYFLCKDGLPLRDDSHWNKDGWRVCSAEVGDQQAIRKFAEHVASLRAELKEAVEIIRLLVGEEGKFVAHETYEGTLRARAFLQGKEPRHG